MYTCTGRILPEDRGTSSTCRVTDKAPNTRQFHAAREKPRGRAALAGQAGRVDRFQVAWRPRTVAPADIASQQATDRSHQSIVSKRFSGSIISPDAEPCRLGQVPADIARRQVSDRSHQVIVSSTAFFSTSRPHSRQSHQPIASVTFSSTGITT
jgi:hypothetical protein